MRDHLQTAVFLATLLAAWSSNAEAVQPKEGRPTAVWIDVVDGPDSSCFERARIQLLEIDVVLAREIFQSDPTVVEAVETLVVHRAMAVIWHDRDGGLQILFEGEGRPERITAIPGGPEEEGLYIAELLRARLEEGDGILGLLATAPAEAPFGVAAKAAAVLKPEATKAARSINRKGLKLGAGYQARVHADEVTWWQHGMDFAVPAWRLSDPWELRGYVGTGLPSSIGERGTQWLELRAFRVGLAIGMLPFRWRWLETKLSAAPGVLNTIAVAFLSDGTSETRSHMSGEITLRLDVVLIVNGRVDLAAFASLSYIMSPPSFGIDGRGDFGAAPWQPAFGFDILFKLS